MKKIITLVCTIACVFGLTACSSEREYTEYEQQKMDMAKEIAEYAIIPYFQTYMDDGSLSDFDGLTAEEIGHIFENGMQLEADGNSIKGAAISFNNAADVIGTIEGIDKENIEAEIDDKTIIVTVPVFGSIKGGKAQIIFSNDMFFRLQSASLNEDSTLGDAMGKAALNTIIGMGTVFIVLVLISFIIALFGYIPKIQAKIEARNKKVEKIESIDNTIAQIVEKEEVDVTDDFELVAVIAAAIAASEGAASTDGFVVRSVRKVNRRR